MKHRTQIRIHSIAALASLVLAAGSAHGQYVLSPVAVVGTDLGAFNDTTLPENMVNQSGVTTPFVSGTTVFDTYFANPGQVFATSGNGGTNNWTSNFSFTLPVKGYVDLDLGAVYRLNKLAIWNRSLKDISVAVRTGINDPGQIAGTFSLIDRQSFSFSYAVDVLPFSGTFEGRYVRLQIDSVHLPFSGATFGYAIVGEVALSALPIAVAPPEVRIAVESDGSITLTFTGTLQSSDGIAGEFTDVPGNPQSTHSIPVAGLADDRFFRSRSD